MVDDRIIESSDRHHSKHTVRSGGFTNSNTSKTSKSDLKKKLSSTWHPHPIHVNTYETQSREQAKSIINKIPNSEFPGIDLEAVRNKRRQAVPPKFEKVILSKYGSVQNLFSQFKKYDGDTISLDEFSNHLRKRAIDTHFPREDQRLLFELFDNDHSNIIQVSNILSYFKNHHNEIKDYNQIYEHELISSTTEKINHARIDANLLPSPRSTKKQLITGLRNLDIHSTGFLSEEQIRYAVGPKYLNLKLTDEETSDLINLVPSSSSEKIDYYKFVNALQLQDRDTELQTHADSFFDARANQVRRMKQRTTALESQASNSALIQRRNELVAILEQENRRNEATTETIYRGSSNAVLTGGGLNGSMPSSSSTSQLLPKSAESKMQTSLSAANLPRFRSLNSVHLDTTYPHVLLDAHERDMHGKDFRLTNNPPAFTKLKFPTSVDVNNEQVYDSPYGHNDKPKTEGKRRGPKEVTDWSRIGCGGDYVNPVYLHSLTSPNARSAMLNTYDSATSLGSSVESFALASEHYRTSASEYFQPLVYESSKPVCRPHIISDAEMSFLKREEKRKQRALRTQSNLQLFKINKELADITSELTAAGRSKGRAHEVLTYETTQFMKDQKDANSRPIHMMQKKPNPALYNKMWGGNLAKSFHAQEDRDFGTTYKQSFLHSGSTTTLNNSQSSTMGNGDVSSSVSYTMTASDINIPQN